MTLHSGYHLTVAPKFHIDADWAARIAVSAGVEEVGGRFFPRGPWRPPTVAELAVLISGAEPHTNPAGVLPMLGQNPSPAPTSVTDTICLFRIPEHLRGIWWDLLDAAVDMSGPVRMFDEFATQVSEFLAFKGLGVPEAAQMEVMVTVAKERSIQRFPNTARSAGLSSTIDPRALWPLRPGVTLQRLHAVVNLGDEPSGVVLINLPLADLAAQLVQRAPGEPEPATVGALVERFFRVCPDYPPVRIQLGPAEGCRLPDDGLVLDSDPTGKAEPDVLLLISIEEPVGEGI